MSEQIEYGHFIQVGFTKKTWDESYSSYQLKDKEVGLETDTKKFKIGDGHHTWNGIPYSDTIYHLSSEWVGVDNTLATTQYYLETDTNRIKEQVSGSTWKDISYTTKNIQVVSIPPEQLSSYDANTFYIVAATKQYFLGANEITGSTAAKTSIQWKGCRNIANIPAGAFAVKDNGGEYEVRRNLTNLITSWDNCEPINEKFIVAKTNDEFKNFVAITDASTYYLDTTTYQIKIGDGVHTYYGLEYYNMQTGEIPSYIGVSKTEPSVSSDDSTALQFFIDRARDNKTGKIILQADKRYHLRLPLKIYEDIYFDGNGAELEIDEKLNSSFMKTVHETEGGFVAGFQKGEEVPIQSNISSMPGDGWYAERKATYGVQKVNTTTAAWPDYFTANSYIPKESIADSNFGTVIKKGGFVTIPISSTNLKKLFDNDTINAINDEVFAYGDSRYTGKSILIKSCQQALNQINGAYWCGTPTGNGFANIIKGMRPAYQEILYINNIYRKNDDADTYIIECCGTSTYPYYYGLKDNILLDELTDLTEKKKIGTYTVNLFKDTVTEEKFRKTFNLTVIDSFTSTATPQDAKNTSDTDYYAYKDGSTYYIFQAMRASTICLVDFIKNVHIANFTVRANAQSLYIDKYKKELQKISMNGDKVEFYDGEPRVPKFEGGRAADQITPEPSDNSLVLSGCENALVENVTIIKGYQCHGRCFTVNNCIGTTIRNCIADARNVYMRGQQVGHTYDNHFTTAASWYTTYDSVTSYKAAQCFDVTYNYSEYDDDEDTNFQCVSCPSIGVNIINSLVKGNTDSAATTHSGGYGITFDGCRFIGNNKNLAIRTPVTTISNCFFQNFINSPNKENDNNYTSVGYGTKTPDYYSWADVKDVTQSAVAFSEPTTFGSKFINNTVLGGGGIEVRPFVNRAMRPSIKELGILIEGNTFKNLNGYGIKTNFSPRSAQVEPWFFDWDETDSGRANETYSDYADSGLSITVKNNIFQDCASKTAVSDKTALANGLIYISPLSNGVAIESNDFIRCSNYRNIVYVDKANKNITIANNNFFKCTAAYLKTSSKPYLIYHRDVVSETADYDSVAVTYAKNEHPAAYSQIFPNKMTLIETYGNKLIAEKVKYSGDETVTVEDYYVPLFNRYYRNIEKKNAPFNEDSAYQMEGNYTSIVTNNNGTKKVHQDGTVLLRSRTGTIGVKGDIHNDIVMNQDTLDGRNRQLILPISGGQFSQLSDTFLENWYNTVQPKVFIPQVTNANNNLASAKNQFRQIAFEGIGLTELTGDNNDGHYKLGIITEEQGIQLSNFGITKPSAGSTATYQDIIQCLLIECAALRHKIENLDTGGGGR